MSPSNTTTSALASTAAILQAAGFQIRGSRATCPHCSPDHNHRSFTVAIHRGLYFCHRCHRGGSIRSLARNRGIQLAAPRVRKADIPKTQFRAWLSEKMTALGNEERLAYKKYLWASAALFFFPDFEPAWNWLVWFFGRRRVWEQFWESASDKLGRFYLYRAWRRHNHVA